MTDKVETVEQLVRAQLAKAFGGKRGIAESAIPTVAFTVCWLVSHDLRLSLILSVGSAVALLLLRIAQRSSVQFVANALFGIAIAAVFALRSGEAKDVFLPGILYNGGYAAVLIVSILVGWPVIGFLVGSVTGDATKWHKDAQMVKLCSLLTWILALPCVLRVIVQYPLWASDQVGWLGTSKIALGWPLQLASLGGMVLVLSRNHTPLDDRTPLEAPE